MRQTIERFVIAFVLALGLLTAIGYGEASTGHDAPATAPRAAPTPPMTPNTAPLPRIAPDGRIAVAKATPRPMPGIP
jgi:hypothetical protein